MAEVTWHGRRKVLAVGEESIRIHPTLRKLEGPLLACITAEFEGYPSNRTNNLRLRFYFRLNNWDSMGVDDRYPDLVSLENPVTTQQLFDACGTVPIDLGKLWGYQRGDGVLSFLEKSFAEIFVQHLDFRVKVHELPRQGDLPVEVDILKDGREIFAFECKIQRSEVGRFFVPAESQAANDAA